MLTSDLLPLNLLSILGIVSPSWVLYLSKRKKNLSIFKPSVALHPLWLLLRHQAVTWYCNRNYLNRFCLAKHLIMIAIFIETLNTWLFQEANHSSLQQNSEIPNVELHRWARWQNVSLTRILHYLCKIICPSLQMTKLCLSLLSQRAWRSFTSWSYRHARKPKKVTWAPH